MQAEYKGRMNKASKAHDEVECPSAWLPIIQ